jgi:hypothetical protein
MKVADAEVRARVNEELSGLTDAEVIVRAGELIELLNRVIVVELADDRAAAALRMHTVEHLTNWQIAEKTGVSPQQIRKLMERGRAVERFNASHKTLLEEVDKLIEDPQPPKRRSRPNRELVADQAA